MFHLPLSYVTIASFSFEPNSSSRIETINATPSYIVPHLSNPSHPHHPQSNTTNFSAEYTASFFAPVTRLILGHIKKSIFCCQTIVCVSGKAVFFFSL